MVNSDCHYPDLVNAGRAEAFELLKKAGFKSTRELIGGQWQDVAIRRNCNAIVIRISFLRNTEIRPLQK